MSSVPGNAGYPHAQDERDDEQGGSKFLAQDRHAAVRRRQLWLLFAVLAVSILVYAPTYVSMVQIWLRSETFVHCLLIFPISGYLIWCRREELGRVAMRPYYPGLIGILGASAIWWLADALDIQAAKQFAVVATLLLLVVTMAGTRFAGTIAFPLGYLLFAVPFGEIAIPYLIDSTAFIAVESLQLTGLPVLREGAFFSIPSGNFEVAKACSGIRYVLASLALGTLYGYLIYDSVRKRILFFLFALVLPIVANGFRAYGIVLIAHYSDMKLATGVDHVIYGWIFFGLIMLIMFWVGDRYRDRPATNESAAAAAPAAAATSLPLARFLPLAGLAVGLVSVGPAAAFASRYAAPEIAVAGLPAQVGIFRAAGDVADWQPAYSGASWSITRRYETPGASVDVGILRYDIQQQDAELVNAMNKVADTDVWTLLLTTSREIAVEGASAVEIRETLIRQQGSQRIVWAWHEVNGVPVDGDLEAKWREALNLLSFTPPISAAVLVSMTLTDDVDAARATLESFVIASWQSLHDCLYARSENATECITADSPNRQADPEASGTR